MSRTILNVLGSIACAALLPALPAASQKPAQAAHSTAKAKPATSARSVWPSEALTGTLTTVDAARHLVIVQDANGTPFDMVVTRSTHIRSGDQTLKVGDLASDVNKKVTLRFVPERRGDVARVIRITG